MTYNKQVWATGPSGNTPINAARLNHMEDGIENAGTGQMGSPILLDPVRWWWGSQQYTLTIPGSSGTVTPLDTATHSILRSTNAVWGDLPMALPSPASTFPAMEVSGVPGSRELKFVGAPVPMGSPANVAIGIQLGDRIAFSDEGYWGNAGVYVVTNLGSVSVPWELTRAVDLPVSDVTKEWQCLVEDFGIVYSVTNPDTTYDWISPSLAQLTNTTLSPGAVATGSFSAAIGLLAFATSYNSLAVGYQAIAGGSLSTAVGFSAKTSAQSATALGTWSHATGTYSTALGTNSEAVGTDSTAVGRGVVATENGVTVVGSSAGSGTIGVPIVGNGGAAVIQGVETTQTASFGIIKKHMGRFIPCNHASTPIVATIPLNATIAFPIGAMFELGCQGAADVTIAIAGGGTLLGTVTATTAGQVLKARKIATDTWWCSLTS